MRLTVLLPLLFVTGASAQSVSAFRRVQFYGTGVTGTVVDEATVLDPTAVALDYTRAVPFPSASSSFHSAEAGFGTLRARTTISVASPAGVTYGGIQSNTSAAFTDVQTVTGDPGGFTFDLSMALTGSTIGGKGSVGVRLEAQTADPVDPTITVWSDLDFINFFDLTGAGTLTANRLYAVPRLRAYRATVTLSAGANLYFGSPTASGFADADFSHTLVVTRMEGLDPLTGASFGAWNSGTTYAPVPEPASLAVLGLGVATLRRRASTGARAKLRG